MNFTKAITRKPGGDFAAGITSVEWEAPPDYDRVCRQHRAYVDTLVDLGLEVALLEDAPGFPDAYFVEDTAVILGDTAVLTRPGAQARMGEVGLMAPVVGCHKNVVAIRPPGLLDGGDVMLTDDRLFIGLSQRTNAEGARQLGREADRIGLPWSTLPVLKALHLKSGVNYMGRDTLLLCDEYVQRPEFMAYDKLVVAADELPAANTLAVNGSLLTPRGYPATRRVLNRMEMPVIELDVSEVIKMDGGLSCLSLRFR